LSYAASDIVGMSKKFKSQASSSRAASGSPAFGFGAPTTPFQTSTSPLAYVTELPDLAALSDPSVVVSFKNLTKKDGFTKAKALEELQADLARWKEQGATIEDAALDAWVGASARSAF
jgi:E3 ubiquitin-protein ligase listerin